MSTIKISELATSDISLSDFIAKAVSTGVATKTTVQSLANVISVSGDSVFRGSLAIADTPTLDGWYFPSETGTYTNAGGLVVTLANNFNIIIISATQTVFELLVSPISTSLEDTTFDVNDNVNGATMQLTSEFISSLPNTTYTDGDGVIRGSVTELSAYINPKGESEYEGDNIYVRKGAGWYEYFDSPTAIRRVEVKMYAGTTTGMDVRIYHTDTLWDGNFSNLTHLKTVVIPKGQCNRIDGNYQNVDFGELIVIPKEKYVYVLFAATVAGSLVFKKWDADDLPARNTLVYSQAANDTQYNSNWALLGNIYMTPFKLYGTIENETPAYDELRLLLPDSLYCAVGQETNIYFDNIILYPNYKEYSFSCVGILNVAEDPIGTQFVERWSFTPSTGQVGSNRSLTITVRDWYNRIVAQKTTSIVIGNTTPVSKTILMIGDSTGDTVGDPDKYPKEVNTLSGAGLTFIGTNDSGNTFKNECLSGQSYEWFATNASSPFVNGGAVDLANYLSVNGFADPDYITLGLGINDIFAGEKTSADIDVILDYADDLIDNFIVDVPTVKIGVFMIINSPNQDAFGNSYGISTTMVQFRRNAHLFNEKVKAKYGLGGTAENASVDIIPVYINLDRVNSMLMNDGSAGINSRNPTIYPRQINGVHPGAIGQLQTADVIQGWIENQ